METQTFDSSEQPEFNTVRSVIAEAFADTVYPGDGNLVEYRGPDYAKDEAYEALKGMTWQRLSAFLSTANHRDMVPCEQSMFFVTPRAFVYYLPAYMLGSIESSDDSLSLQESLLFLLTNPKGPDIWSLRDRAAPLSSKQIAAVLSYLSLKRSQNSLFDSGHGGAIDFWKSQLDGRIES